MAVTMYVSTFQIKPVHWNVQEITLCVNTSSLTISQWGDGSRCDDQSLCFL